MSLVFISQGYTQQPSKTQFDVFENVLCNVFQGKAFGKTYLKFIPITDELLDTSDSDSTGNINSTSTEQI